MPRLNLLRAALAVVATFAAGAWAEANDSTRAALLLKTLSYDRHLSGGSEPFEVALVGAEAPRRQLARELGKTPPLPIKGHPVTFIECGEDGDCDQGRLPKAVLLLPGIPAPVLKSLVSTAHRAGRYTLALDSEQVLIGAMIGLTADNHTVLNGEALSTAKVDFEPAFSQRAQLVAKAPAEDFAVELPEHATAPVELTGNARPQYPPSAVEEEKEGEVVLRIVIRADGRVGGAQVVEGEKVFAEPALAAVRTWRWKPAVLDGHPITVYRIIRMPFRLQ